MTFNVLADISGSPVSGTGSVVIGEHQSLKLYPFGIRGTYFLEFRFTRDLAGQITISNYNETSGHIVEIRNYVGPEPITVTSPLYVAVNKNRKIFLQFSVQNVGSSPTIHLVNYTFFDGGEVS